MSLTIGKQLKLTRQSKNLTIENVAEVTHIRSAFIEYLEEDNFEAFSSAAQARGFLHNYADYLGLKVADLWAHQRETISPAPNIQQSSDNEPAQESLKPATTSQVPEFIDNQESRQTASSGDETAFNKPGTGKSDLEAEDQDREDEPGSNIKIEPKAGARNPEDNETIDGSAKAIFTSIGEELSSRRKLLGMSLEEIERHIHVRKFYLDILESGGFEKLPSSVQARGMINNYAHFLDMDADKLLLRFADGLQIQRQENLSSGKNLEKSPHRSKVQRGIRRYISIDMLIGAGLIIILLVFAVWGTNKIISMQDVPTVEATAPSISEILLVTPTTNNLPITEIPEVIPVVLPSASGQTDLAATLASGSTGNLQLIVIAQERALVVVTVDGVEKFNGRVVPDTAYPYDAKKQIEVLTSNGAAIKITHNGTDLGVMGTFGQVVHLIYTSTSIITPTSTSTPTATVSPIPSATPVPSATPKPSATSPLPSSRTP